MNYLNLYSLLNVMESPILIFNSVCNYCKTYFSLNLNQTIPRNYLYLISSEPEKNNILYEELYSKSKISSSLFTLNNSYSFDIRSSSNLLIQVILNKINKRIEIKNI